jgi:hypothetical protein
MERPWDDGQIPRGLLVRYRRCEVIIHLMDGYGVRSDNGDLMRNVTQTRTHYEAGWTDSWSHRRCLHKHRTLEAAAKCATKYGAVGYVFAVEGGVGRELRATEENVVHAIRFGKALRKPSAEKQKSESITVFVPDRVFV